MAAKAPNLEAERDAANAYLEFWSKGSTQGIFFQYQPGVLPTASDSDTSTYTELQKKAVEIVSKAKRITQFLDRDTRPDFATQDGMQRFLQTWLAKPDQDMVAYQKSIQDFWDQLPPL
jgi:multiple sugar transport system substrate-binding protein